MKNDTETTENIDKVAAAAHDAARKKKLTAVFLATDPEYQQIVAKEAEQRALHGSAAKHRATMLDHKSGNALERGIAGFQVKAAIADFASANGRQTNGAKVTPKVVTPISESNGVSATEETASA